MDLYSVLLPIHNILRWVVVIAAVVAIAGSWLGVLQKKEWTKGDRLRGVGFVAAMDVQLLVGMILYFTSPLIQQGFEDFGAAMKEAGIRYFLVEHIFLMVIAVALAHVGSVMAKKADTDSAKFKRAAIFFTISFVLVLVRTPWFRPLFPEL